MKRSWLIIGASFLALLVIGVAYFVWQTGLDQDLKRKGLETAKGDFWEAEPVLKEYASRRPHDVEVLSALARGYLKASRNSEAEEYLNRWVEQSPNEPQALLLRIDLYRELGRFDKAILDANRLIELDADNVDWRRKRLAALFAAGRFAEAQDECQICLNKRPRDAWLLRTLAEIKRARADYAGAGTILDSLLRDSPRDTGVMMIRGLVHVDQNEPEKAIPYFRKVLELDKSRQYRSRYYLALALNRIGETAEAERLTEENRRLTEAAMLFVDSEGQPDNVHLQMRTAQAHIETGDAKDLAKAVGILRHVLSMQPHHAGAHATLADALDKQGLHDQAAAHRQRAKEKQ